MTRRSAIALIMLFLAAGCGRGSASAVEDPVQDSLDGMKQCLSEALNSVRALTQPPPKEYEEAEKKMVGPLPAALAAVVAAAKDLVDAAAGKPAEPDARAILSAAQELEAKARGASSAAAIEQGIQELRSKVAGLRAKR